MSAAAALDLEDPRDCWETPRMLWRNLDARWSFDVDAAASYSNAHVVARYWTRREDGIAQLGDPDNDRLRAWCNPPYSDIDPWARAMLSRCLRGAPLGVMLLPANRTQMAWFHEYAMRGEIWWFRGRIPFVPPPGITATTNSRNSMLVVFDPATLDQGIQRSVCAKTGAVL